MKMSKLIDAIEDGCFSNKSHIDRYGGFKIDEDDSSLDRVNRAVLKKRVRLYTDIVNGKKAWVADGLKSDEMKSLSEILPSFKYIPGFKGSGVMSTYDHGDAMELSNKIGIKYDSVEEPDNTVWSKLKR